MNEGSSRKQRSSRAPLIVIVVAVVFFAWLAALCVGIVRAGARPELQPADAIVVFGAAEYSGHPSPVYRARLDHAYDLFQQGLAPTVITTGGAAADPSFSEGGVGHDYLMHRGIPEANLIAETQGSDTAQSAERVAVIMRENHMQSALAVSDTYHVFRIRKLLEHQGITVYVAPRPDSRPHGFIQRTDAVLREAFSYMFWRLHLTG
ncbi:MAG TPA: YdcF family protein [Terriglobales bacterium]